MLKVNNSQEALEALQEIPGIESADAKNILKHLKPHLSSIDGHPKIEIEVNSGTDAFADTTPKITSSAEPSVKEINDALRKLF